QDEHLYPPRRTFIAILYNLHELPLYHIDIQKIILVRFQTPIENYIWLCFLTINIFIFYRVRVTKSLSNFQLQQTMYEKEFLWDCSSCPVLCKYLFYLQEIF
ncbi:hypothetical protein V8G54_027897, partial [Vigna mungo]